LALSITGFLLKQPGWTHLNLPATADESLPVGNGKIHHRRVGEVLHPEREPRHVLDDIQRTLGSVAFQAQYQQAPVPETGNMLKKEWLKYYQAIPDRKEGDLIVQSWDTAMKDKEHNDYSVCTTWRVRNNTYYLRDVVRRRCDYPTLLQLILGQYSAWQADSILIEEQAFGAALIPDLRRNYGIHAIGVVAMRDKINRFSVVLPQFEAGQVLLLQGAPWLGEFLEEMLSFPQTRFNDQVDSVSQFLNWHRQRISFSYEFM
jgi:predicted phage terminase large subunit-like protein